MADTSPPVSGARALLVFGSPTTSAIPSRVGPSPFPPRPRTPTPRRQGTRLTPQFQALQDALRGERAQLAETTESADPELVVVFDLAGSVDNFLRTCARIDGLEFLADLKEDQVAADDDFFFEDGEGVSDEDIPQSLYMVMSNAQAVTELLRLFALWQENPRIRFETGLNSLKDVFALLRTVRRWGPEDRIRETRLLEEWREDAAIAQGGTARVEIELWFRDDEGQRRTSQQEIENLIISQEGRIVSTSTITDIRYHGVLAEIPHHHVEAVLAGGPEAIQLLTTESVMFVGPARPMAIPPLEPTSDGIIGLSTELPDAEARVALLDGLPLAGHVTLRDRVIIDDPDEIGPKYTAGQQSHGTAMASLIIHGDLSSPGPAISGRLYVRPILEPHAWQVGVEVSRVDVLLVDLIHRAFHRIFEGDGEREPAAPKVRVVNLSFGDPVRMFVRRVSPLAKLLDWLSYRYNVVIVVSAGNHPVNLEISSADMAEPERVRQVSARSHHAQARHHRLLSPAESINALTVGALHSDDAEVAAIDTVIDSFDTDGPAGYSATGFGFRRSVKPEVHLPGGRELYVRPAPGDHGPSILQAARTAMTGPGIRAAAPGAAGSLEGAAYTYGSSNASALATRAVEQILEVLSELRASPGEFAVPDSTYHPVLAKTLLVHAARWGDAGTLLRERLELDPHRARRELTQLLGYGAVDQGRIANADRVRAVLIGASEIGKDKRQVFHFPLPAALRATTEWRRLTITLGWFSPINPRSQRYRMARLSLRPPRAELGVEPKEADASAIAGGTVQHYVLEGSDAVAFVDGAALSFNVDCRVDAGRLDGPVKFGLAVSLEVGTNVQADIQQQVRQGLQEQVRERLQARVPVQ